MLWVFHPGESRLVPWVFFSSSFSLEKTMGGGRMAGQGGYRAVRLVAGYGRGRRGLCDAGWQGVGGEVMRC